MKINFNLIKAILLPILFSTNIAMAGSSSSSLIDPGSSLYGINIVVEGDGAGETQFNYNTAEALFNAIDNTNLEDEFSGYDAMSSTVSSNINYRRCSFNKLS